MFLNHVPLTASPCLAHAARERGGPWVCISKVVGFAGIIVIVGGRYVGAWAQLLQQLEAVPSSVWHQGRHSVYVG